MIVVGLTGSIGMGKSTASSMLRDMGVSVHDSDQVVKDMMVPHGRAIAPLAKHFPEAYDSSDNSIDRALLGKIVFSDDDRRRTLENIIHPLVWESQQNFLRTQRTKGQKLVVLDIPLLFETGANQAVDKVIVVTAPAFIQRKRVMKRDKMTESKFKGILLSQMPDHEKRAKADYVVQTGLGRAFTYRALKKIIGELLNDQNRHNFPPYA